MQAVADPDNLTFNFPLAAGLLQSVANQLLAQVNDANSALTQFLGRTVQGGRFWGV